MPKGRAKSGMRMFNDAVPNPCEGHACDHCSICQRGRCCRNDYPQYQLPEEGSWDGSVFGRIGVLNEDGMKAECHICGLWFQNVGSHAWGAHGITSDEYRAYFGLNRETGLCGAYLSERMSEKARRQFAIQPLMAPSFTPEQLSAFTKGKKQRTQFRLSPAYQRVTQARERNDRRRHERALVEQPCVVCGKPVVRKSSLMTSRKIGVTCSKECLNTLRSQLSGQRTYDEEARRHMSEGKKGVVTDAMRAAHERLRRRVERVCSQCGRSFTLKVSRALRGEQYCSRACHSAAHSVEKACEHCGKIVRLPKIRHATFRFCSRACKDGFFQQSDHCKNGHLWAPDTIRYGHSGYKICLICQREAAQRYLARRAGVAPASE